MRNDEKIVVIDTNVLVDHPNIIPEGDSVTKIPSSSNVDLTGAHIVIPSAVVRELSSFKSERTDRERQHA